MDTKLNNKNLSKNYVRNEKTNENGGKTYAPSKLGDFMMVVSKFHQFYFVASFNNTVHLCLKLHR